MPDGKLRACYWEIFTALAEIVDLLDPTHQDHSFPSEDEVEYTALLHATLVFKDGSRLIVHSWLDTTAEVREHDYAYVYLDAQGNRVLHNTMMHPTIRNYPPIPTTSIRVRSLLKAPIGLCPWIFHE